MEYQLELFRWTRKNIITLLSSISEEMANSIPYAFNNNILWNAGHVYWAQQMLVYKFSGLEPNLPAKFAEDFATGSFPNSSAKWSLGEIFNLLEEGTKKTIEDYHSGTFIKYTPFIGMYDSVSYELNTCEEAFQYNTIHETRHYGFMVALKKAIQ